MPSDNLHFERNLEGRGVNMWDRGPNLWEIGMLRTLDHFRPEKRGPKGPLYKGKTGSFERAEKRLNLLNDMPWQK